jgi:hypothetical protein
MAEKLKSVNIKGKEYVEVNERVKYFRKNYVGWRLETELVSNEDGVCVFKAIIRDETGEIVSTGYAYERESSSFINKTSYIENCETSAVGRALGFLGIGIDTSIASSDEVTNAINNQAPQKIDFKEVRQKIMAIKSQAELMKYWKELNLSEKQANILKDDFAKRKEELGGNNGVE